MSRSEYLAPRPHPAKQKRGDWKPCGRRAFATKQAAINASHGYAVIKTVITKEPEYCARCDNWHMVFGK